MGIKNSKAWRALAELLLTQGLRLLVPYVSILANPAARWAIRLIVGKFLDKHLDRVQEVKAVRDEAKAKTHEAMKNFVRRKPF